MTQTPASLLDRLRLPNDPEAWERFVLLYSPLLLMWAREVGLGESEAADLVQDVFVTLIQTLPSFEYDGRRSFRRWLRTVALNKWRDRRRKIERSPVEGARALREEDLPAGESDDFWEREFRQRLVSRALAVMRRDFKPATWQAFWGQVVEGRAPAELAAELGLTVGAVYAARIRVLDRLRLEMAGMLD